MTFPFFEEGGGGGDTYLKFDFYEGRATKILNFALKIKGGGREGGTYEVLRPCHPPQNLKRALCQISFIYYGYDLSVISCLLLFVSYQFHFLICQLIILPF